MGKSHTLNDEVVSDTFIIFTPHRREAIMSSPAPPESGPSVLKNFFRISAIPRASGNEERIAEWMVAWAREQGFDPSQDRAGNIVVRVPATPGCESLAPIILQSHLDMVCEKSQDSSHDFTSDPICPLVEGDWLRGDGTTLGADNGIGMAIGMALAEDHSLRRPALELLFTVEEETGLSGAQNLDAAMLRGRTLINIDSEEEGVLVVGCAGGENARIDLPMTREDTPASHPLYRLVVSGLRGGHSGMNIGEKRGNANKIIAGILDSLMSDIPLRLVTLEGGSRSNVIPRDAVAIFTLPPDTVEKVQQLIKGMTKTVKEEFSAMEKKLSITLTPGAFPTAFEKAFSAADSRRCIGLLTGLPHGVHCWSEELDGVVETSNNLAIVRSGEETVNILCFQRSSKMTELQSLTSSIGLLAERYGARFHRDGLYPGWQPRLDSPLLAHCRGVFKNLFSREAKVTMTHGGLECGILGQKLPGLEMISLGPTIENAHSPQERVHIASVEATYRFLKALLASFAS